MNAQPPTPATLSPAFSDYLTNPADPPARFGLLPSDAQAVTVTPSFSAWLIPGTNGICLAVPRSGLGGNLFTDACTSVATAQSGGFFVVIEAPGPAINGAIQSVYGVVPNGNVSVTIINADGSSESVPVVNNVYYYASNGQSPPAELVDQSASAGTYMAPISPSK